METTSHVVVPGAERLARLPRPRAVANDAAVAASAAIGIAPRPDERPASPFTGRPSRPACRSMHEFALMQRGIGLVMCLAFPVVVLAMTVAYIVVLRRDARETRDETRRDG